MRFRIFQEFIENDKRYIEEGNNIIYLHPMDLKKFRAFEEWVYAGDSANTYIDEYNESYFVGCKGKGQLIFEKLEGACMVFRFMENNFDTYIDDFEK